MTLLFPAALGLLAALAPVVIALYLRRVRRRVATVSTLLFWERVLAEQPRRTFLGRLRRIASLLLQLFLLALLALALARPEVARFFGRDDRPDDDGGNGRNAVVLVLDARASMQAREPGSGAMVTVAPPTRFERAREAARAFARRAGPGRAVGVLAVEGPIPRLLAPLAEDDRPALAALDTLVRPTDAGGTLDEALDLAAGLLAAQSPLPSARTEKKEKERRRVIVFSDRPAPASEIAGVPVETVLADDRGGHGSHDGPRENVALGHFGVRARPDSPQTLAATGEILNAGAHRQRGEAELSLDGRLLDVRPFDLGPGERATLSFPALATNTSLANARGWLRLRLRRPPDADGPTADALAADDEVRAALPAARPLRVLLVSGGNWFLENLLRADAGISFDLLDPAAFRPETAGNFDAVLLDDLALESLPALSRPDALPSAGNFLFIRRTPFDDPAAPALERPLVADTDPASPLLRLTDWRVVTLSRAGALPSTGENEPTSTPVVAPGGWRLSAPVRTTGERPLVLAGERRGGTDGRTQRLVALPFGLTEGDLPLRVAFPLFMANTVRWLAGADRDDATTPTILRAGDTFALAAGETLWTRPQREVRPVPDPLPAGERLDGPGVFQPLENGFYLVRRANAATAGDRWLAVNTDDFAVSTLNVPPTPSAADTLAVLTTAAPGGWWESALHARPPWVTLALAAFILSSLEWGWFHRRRTE